MEHSTSASTVYFNIGVQALNLLLFFAIFYFGFAKSIVASLQSRKDLIKKLQFADQEYQTIIGNANQASKEIIDEANSSKKSMIEEAQMLAKQKADEIIWTASNKAESIVSDAKVQANSLESEIKSNYESLVKTTAGSYLKKIFDKEPDLQSAYIKKVSEGIVE